MEIKVREIIIVTSFVLLVKGILLFWGHINFDYETHPANTILSIWNRWDALHYQRIAEHGYGEKYLGEDNRFLIYFPPMYPAIISLVKYISGCSYYISSLIASNLFSVLASVLLYSLVKDETGSSRTAFRAVALLSVFPTAYFLMAPYAEATFLFFLLLCFYAMNKKRYFLISIAATGAILSRSIGFIVLPVIFFHFRRKRNSGLRIFLCMIIPTASFFSQNLVGYLYHNDIMFLYNYRPPYTIQFASFPFKEAWLTLISIWKFPSLLTNIEYAMTKTWSAVFLLAASYVMVMGVKRMERNNMMFGSLYIFFLSTCSHLIALPRYILCCFPIYFILSFTISRFSFYLIFASFFGLMLHFSYIFLNGSWAF